MNRRLGAGAWAALAAVPVAVLVAAFGLQDHYRFADEAVGVLGGRQLHADFFGSILDPQFSSRPLERLLAMVWAASLALTPTSAGAFQLAHVLVAIIAASAAIPVALLLRGLGTATPWAVAGGVIAVTGPWAIMGVPLLNNAPGMTAFAWLLVAGQRVVTKPGPKSDLLFCVAALALGVTRAGNMPLAAGIAPAVVYAAWVRGGGPVGFVRELLRRHWVLVALAVAAAGVLAVRGFAGLFGTYGAGRSTYLPWDLLGPGIRALGGHLSVATGLIAFAFAVPWIARGVLRPEQRGATAERAFALTAISCALVFTYVYAPALNEDRYFMVLTPLIVVPFVHAVTTRRLGLGWLVPGVVVLGAFLARGTDWGDSPDAFFTVPAAQWWNRVVEGRLSFLPGDAEVGAVVLVVVAASAAGFALARWGARAAWVPGVILGLVLVHQVVSATYVMDRWIDERGRPELSFAELTFVDRATDGEKTAMLLRTNPQGDFDLPLEWDAVGYWNQELHGTLDIEPQPPCCLGGNYVAVWNEDGVLGTGLTGPYIVVPWVGGASLAGRDVAPDPHRVIEVSAPARFSYRTVIQKPTRTQVDVYPRNVVEDGRTCLTGHFADVTLVRVRGNRTRIRRDGDRASVVLPHDQRVEVDMLHPEGATPAGLDVTRC